MRDEENYRKLIDFELANKKPNSRRVFKYMDELYSLLPESFKMGFYTPTGIAMQGDKFQVVLARKLVAWALVRLREDSDPLEDAVLDNTIMALFICGYHVRVLQEACTIELKLALKRLSTELSDEEFAVVEEIGELIYHLRNIIINKRLYSLVGERNNGRAFKEETKRLRLLYTDDAIRFLESDNSEIRNWIHA